MGRNIIAHEQGGVSRPLGGIDFIFFGTGKLLQLFFQSFLKAALSCRGIYDEYVLHFENSFLTKFFDRIHYSTYL